MWQGIGVSAGRGVGRAVPIMTETPLPPDWSQPLSEQERLDGAVERLRALLSTVGPYREAPEAMAVLRAQLAVLNDPSLRAAIAGALADGATAEGAIEAAFAPFCAALSGNGGTEVAALRDSLLQLLQAPSAHSIPDHINGAVLVLKTVTPVLLCRLQGQRPAAVVSENGSYACHSAILLRALGVPAVFGVEDIAGAVQEGELLLVDGDSGTVTVQPNAQDSAFLQPLPCSGVDTEKISSAGGSNVRVNGTVGSVTEAQSVLQNGGDGIGLFRTELLFMAQERPPTEAAQLAVYAALVALMQDRETVIRTLDCGGDKPIGCLPPEKEDNPLLGRRGIRYCLDYPALFKTQLRALLRAAVYGNVKLLLPMVTTPEEVQAVRGLLKTCAAELEQEEQPYRTVPLGVMIETPSAALTADLLAREADFFSVGTNDLTGYVMAADRGNRAVSGWLDPFRPAVLRAVEMTLDSAKKTGIPVGVCGEAAADEAWLSLLAEKGVASVSVPPHAIAKMRRTLPPTRI